MEPTMFISFAVLEILDQSLFFDVLMSSSASVEIHKRKRNNLTSYNPHNGGPTWAQWQYNYTKIKMKFSIALI